MYFGHSPASFRAWPITVIHRLPAVSEKKVVFPPDSWGELLGVLPDLPRHLTCGSRALPEGVTSFCCCAGCGARREILHRGVWEAFCKTGDPADLAGMQHDTGLLWEQWMATHGGCLDRWEAPSLPAELAAFTEALRGMAVRDLAQAIPANGHLYLVDASGEAYAIPLDDLPCGSISHPRVRPAAIARRLWAVRTFIRVRRLEVQAAVLVSEVWVGTDDSPLPPALDPDRTEALAVALVTPDRGWYGLSHITRASGSMGEGAGTVEQFVWNPLGGQNRFLDALLLEVASGGR